MSNEAKKRVCAISGCKSCEGYNLQYRYLNIHLNEKSLEATLKLLYEYDSFDEQYKKNNLFGIKFGLAFVTVLREDFLEFKNTIENIVLEKMNLPEIKLS